MKMQAIVSKSGRFTFAVPMYFIPLHTSIDIFDNTWDPGSFSVFSIPLSGTIAPKALAAELISTTGAKRVLFGSLHGWYYMERHHNTHHHNWFLWQGNMLFICIYIVDAEFDERWKMIHIRKVLKSIRVV